jgi:putative membrane protein
MAPAAPRARQPGRSTRGGPVLSEEDKQAIVARVAHVEAATGVQVVTAVVERADAYPELVWKAFALAASLAALVVVALDVLRPDWMSAYAALTHVLPVLAAGALSALFAAYVPAYARLYLRALRRDGESRQCAESMFLDHDLACTPARTSVLLFVARFERKVELLADRGFLGRIAPAEWDTVIDTTAAGLARGEGPRALFAGLDRLESLLLDRGFRGGTATGALLADAPIETSGP